jgi:hypothetical protein
MRRTKGSCAGRASYLHYPHFGETTLANASGIRIADLPPDAGRVISSRFDDNTVATQKMEHTAPIILQFDEPFDVGADTGTPVDDSDYQVPFKFTGKVTPNSFAVSAAPRGVSSSSGSPLASVGFWTPKFSAFKLHQNA